MFNEDILPLNPTLTPVEYGGATSLTSSIDQSCFTRTLIPRNKQKKKSYQHMFNCEHQYISSTIANERHFSAIDESKGEVKDDGGICTCNRNKK
ncbi:unnamed protein product [Lactuca virosa]|uniref:Uncharacterized protein n=1 Tax=Lactuca virosa TaxID=75947 RepID=A0AAU9M441_9ASTR|nr:unnamed protein product [Lactuca virosa]